MLYMNDRQGVHALCIGLLIALTVGHLPIAAQTVVPCGQGSYASEPPAEEGDGPRAMLARKIYVTGDATNRPVPTNDWWTDLLISPFVGDLWAYPLVVSADEQGVNVFWPQTFKDDGSGMEKGPALRIRGLVEPAQQTNDLLLSHFDGVDYRPWLVTGEAFGKKPAAGSGTGQMEVKGFLGAGLVNSYANGGDGKTGRLTSPRFPIRKAYLHFLIGGGNHPGTTGVNLVMDGKVVMSATGDNSEDLKWVSWDVRHWQGKTAMLEIVDDDSGGWGHVLADQFIASDDMSPEGKFDTRFRAEDARALAWGDWTVTFRLAAKANDRFMDVTVGRGLPAVWIQLQGLNPVIPDMDDAVLFDAKGQTIRTPFTGDHVGIEVDGRRYGIYGPAAMQMEQRPTGLHFTFSDPDSYLVVCPLLDRLSLQPTHTTAYARPVDSRMTCFFEPEHGRVRTVWDIETKPLRGTETRVVQGWLPHHVRGTVHHLLLDGPVFDTPRGKLRCTTGHSAEISYPWTGVLPLLPPASPGKETPAFDVERMRSMLARYSEKNEYGGDTYWGGKDLVVLAHYLGMARQLNDPSQSALQETLTRALTDWFTYTPGESEHYFARYENWGALIGFNESYWSHQFTDNHFHYGYFTTAAALLGMADRTFLTDFGPMVRRVAKQYANWERDDPDFPYLRTFDIWGGHSWAGGFGSPGGNNQESSSEAMQSWGGLFLLGLMMGDKGMLDTGAMGYAIEANATREYWFNEHGDNWPSRYTHPVVGILFGGGQAYATYFSGDPAWIHGIQWLPISPFLTYLIRDPAFAAAQLKRMLADRKIKEGSDDVTTMGSSLGNVVLGYGALADPEWTVNQFETLWNAQRPVVTDNYTGGISYYMSHAMRRLGHVDWASWTDAPASTVFRNPQTGIRRYVVYNPETVSRKVIVYEQNQPAGHLMVPPHTLLDTEHVETEQR
jgi:hypothetical protein